MVLKLEQRLEPSSGGKCADMRKIMPMSPRESLHALWPICDALSRAEAPAGGGGGGCSQALNETPLLLLRPGPSQPPLLLPVNPTTSLPFSFFYCLFFFFFFLYFSARVHASVQGPLTLNTRTEHTRAIVCASTELSGVQKRYVIILCIDVIFGSSRHQNRAPRAWLYPVAVF